MTVVTLMMAVTVTAYRGPNRYASLQERCEAIVHVAKASNFWSQDADCSELDRGTIEEFEEYLAQKLSGFEDKKKRDYDSYEDDDKKRDYDSYEDDDKKRDYDSYEDGKKRE